MPKLTKMNILISLFFVLLIVLAIKPRVITNMYSSIAGRCVLILIVLFFSMNNITLGLLTALIIIIASNMFLLEGIETMDKPQTAVDSNTVTEDKPKDETKEKETGTDTDITTYDLESIKDSIKPIDSNSLDVSTLVTPSTEPAPSTTDGFKSMYAPV